MQAIAESLVDEVPAHTTAEDAYACNNAQQHLGHAGFPSSSHQVSLAIKNPATLHATAFGPSCSGSDRLGCC